MSVKYRIKDLAKLTGFSPARIRKWQERHRMLLPERHSNGYWYYSNDDYIALMNIRARLERGERLKDIISLPRESLLAAVEDSPFNEEQLGLLDRIKRNAFPEIEQDFESRFCEPGDWVENVIRPALVTVGLAWQYRLLTVAEEHSFSHWIRGYLLGKAQPLQTNNDPDWLIVTLPGDEHELGALCHFYTLVAQGNRVRFCGHLPERYLMEEIRRNAYHTVSISCVLPADQRKLQSLENKIQRVAPNLRIVFGGSGTIPQLVPKRPPRRQTRDVHSIRANADTEARRSTG